MEPNIVTMHSNEHNFELSKSLGMVFFFETSKSGKQISPENRNRFLLPKSVIWGCKMKTQNNWWRG